MFLIDLKFYTDNPIPTLQTFYLFHWGTLLTPSFIIFPQLIRLFYYNLHDTSKGDNISLTSIVKGRKFTLNAHVLGHLLDVEFPDDFVTNDFTKSLANDAKSLFTLLDHSTATQSPLMMPQKNVACFSD